ncbi:hypothetical protein LXL04_014091 [Taraxacum kok-saghyz]
MEGHDRSERLKAFIPNMEDVVADYLAFFTLIVPNYPNLLKFLFGESMGDALCLLIECTKPKSFNGAILIASMCKISDKERLRWPIPKVLMFVPKFASSLAIVPTTDLAAVMNLMRYARKPRVGTMMELLQAMDYLSSQLSNVNIPFIVLHGNVDVVTDPEVADDCFTIK